MIQLNYRDSRPFYRQIKDNIRLLVIEGEMKADEKLPSVRELAAELAINPNTIQRAYRELEAEGYIYSIQGKGSFVSGVSPELEKRREELLRVFDETVSELVFLGVPGSDLTRRLKDALEGNDEDDTSK